MHAPVADTVAYFADLDAPVVDTVTYFGGNHYFLSIIYIGFIPAEKGCPCCADGCHYLLLDCIYNCSLRWSAIFHVVTLQIINKGFFFFKFCLGARSCLQCTFYAKSMSKIKALLKLFKLPLHRLVDLNSKTNCVLVMLNLFVFQIQFTLKKQQDLQYKNEKTIQKKNL